MKNVKGLAASSVKALESFIVEFEQSHTLPTHVYMTEAVKKAIEHKFPYLIEEDYYNSGRHKLKILITNESDNSLGVSFCLDTECVLEY